MNRDEAKSTFGRVDAIWPAKKAPTQAERDEWMSFLKPMDGKLALRALDLMRDSVMWRPTMAEFDTYYRQAAAFSTEGYAELPAGTGAEATDMLETYGSRQEDWIYCWKCDMAIALEELAARPYYSERRGLHHERCPRKGSAPLMPVHLRLERESYWQKHNVTRRG